MKIVLAALLMCMPVVAWAGDVRKCTAQDGKVTYSDSPCAASSSAARVDVSHAAPTVDQERAIAKLRGDLAADADAQRRAESRAQQAARDAALADALAYRPTVEPVVIEHPYPVYYPSYGCGFGGCAPPAPKHKTHAQVKTAAVLPQTALAPKKP